jgi:nicotinate-nucleotide adenylyltransferase
MAMAKHGLKPLRRGPLVGLFGGSFHPAHEGHRHVADVALKRLGLTRVWWLVTPGNPLKDNGRLAPLEARLAQTQRLAKHPRYDVLGIEARLKTRYTVDTVQALQRRMPHMRFVLIMGADSFVSLHRWKNWAQLLRLVPVLVVDRPGFGLRAGLSPAAQRFASTRVSVGRLQTTRKGWALAYGPMVALSSTMLRGF